MEVILIVISHVSWYKTYLYKADSDGGSIASGSSFIIGPLEEASQLFWWHHPIEGEGCP